VGVSGDMFLDLNIFSKGLFFYACYNSRNKTFEYSSFKEKEVIL